MKPEELRRRYAALLYTLSSALAGERPMAQIPAGGIYSYAVRHSLGALAAHALELSGIATDEALDGKLRAARRSMLFATARAELTSELDRAGIAYVRLKGVVMKDLYPDSTLREMSDNDILIPFDKRRAVRKIMSTLGYTVESYGKGHHDVYTKEPIYNFEIHISLFGSRHESLCEYFSDFLERAERVSDSTCERRMRDEDFYIYMKAHEYKHYMSGGIGLRSLVDTYVFTSRKSDSLDFDYITSECEKIGIAEYESRSRALACKLFAPESRDMLLSYFKGEGELDLTDSETEMLDYISSSGTYGKVSQEIENAMHRYESEHKSTKGAKLRFILRRVFPPMSFYKENAPIVYKVRVLIPFYCIGRLIVALVKRPARIFAQLRSLKKYKK